MAGSAALELKVDIKGERSTKMRFPMTFTVHEAIKEIWTTKIGKSEKDHGLFVPKEGSRKGKAQWLKPERTLRYYDLHDGDLVMYKKRHRAFRYQLIDGTSKTVLIDESDIVEKICERIAEHIGLKNHLEFGLRRIDDKNSWLDKNVTLHAQDIAADDPNLVLMYAREFFGEPLDQNDPFQLQLNFVQATRAVIDSDYPCTRKEAVLFAALQIQVQFGNHDVQKHVPGFFDKTLILPEKWRKDKNIDQDILNEHKKLYGMANHAAKYRYYQQMKALRSFGITFFDGKEIFQVESKGKQKTKHRDVKIGISRYEVVFLEFETNEFIYQFDLEKLKSYYALHGVVKLDFGDHHSDVITVTTENKAYADKIVQLISGYIDLILAARQDVGRVVDDDDDEIAEAEDQAGAWMLPSQMAVTGNAGQYSQGGHPMMFGGPMGYMMGGPGMGMMPMMPRSQQVKVTDLNSAMKATSFLANELGTQRASWKQDNKLTLEQARNQFLNDRQALAAAVNNLLSTVRLDPRGIQRHEMDVRAQQLASLMQSVGAGARALAVFDRGYVLDGAKAVADSLVQVLKLIDTVIDHPDDLGSIIALGEAEKAVMAAQRLLEEGNADKIADSGSKQLMATSIMAVDASMAEVIDAIQILISKLPDEAARTRLTMELKKYEATKPWLISTMAQLIPVILEPSLNDEVARCRIAVKELTDNMNTKVLTALQTANIDVMTAADLNTAAVHLMESLAHLLESTKTAEPKTIEGDLDFATPASILTNSLAQLRSGLADAEKLVAQKAEIAQGPDVITVAKLLEFAESEMTKTQSGAAKAAVSPRTAEAEARAIPVTALQAFIRSEGRPPTTLRTDPLIMYVKQCARATNDVTSVVRNIARDAEPETQERLVQTAQALADGTKLLIERSRELFKDHTNPILLGKVDSLEASAQQLITDAGGMSALVDLRYAAKVACSKTITTMGHGKKASGTISDSTANAGLEESLKNAGEALTEFLTDIQLASAAPQDFSRQVGLQMAARQRLPNFQFLVNATKSAALHCDNQNLKQNLTAAASDLHDALAKLMKAITSVGDITGQSKIEEALEDFDAAKADLDTAEFSAAHGLLQPIPGQTRENAIELLNAGVSALVKSVGDMSVAARAGEPLPDHIRTSAAAVSQVVAAVRAVASTVTDRDAQKRMLATGQLVTVETLNVISHCRVLAVDIESADKSEHLDYSITKLRSVLNDLLAAPKGLDSRDVYEAQQAIALSLDGLRIAIRDGARASDPEFKEATKLLASSAKALSAAVAQFSAMAIYNPLALGSSAKVTSVTTSQLMAASGVAANASQSDAGKKNIAGTARHLGESLIELMELSKATAGSRSPETIGAFKAKEEAVKNDMVQLIRHLGTASSQESEEAVASIEALIRLFDDEEGQGLPKLSRAELLERFFVSARNLALVSANLSRAANVSAAKVGQAAKEAVFAVDYLVESARSANKSAVGLTELQGRMLTACRLVIEQPLNTKKVISLCQGLLLAAEKEIELSKAIQERVQDPEEKKRLAASTMQLLNTMERLATLARVSLTHDDGDVSALVECVKEASAIIRLEASLTRPYTNPRTSDTVEEVVAAQLSEVARTIAINTSTQIRAATAFTIDEDNEFTKSELTRSAQSLTSALQDLIAALGSLNPGVGICEAAGKAVQDLSQSLELALNKFDDYKLVVKKPLADCQSDAAVALKALSDHLLALTNASKAGDTFAFEQTATQVNADIPLFSERLRLVVSATDDQDARNNLLDQAKRMSDSLYALLRAATTAHPSDQTSVAKLVKCHNSVQENVSELLNELQSSANLVSDLERAAAQLEALISTIAVPVETSKRYGAIRSELGSNTKSTASTARQFLMLDAANLGEVSVAATGLANDLRQLITSVQEAVSKTSDSDARNLMKQKTTELAKEVVKMIRDLAASVQGDNRTEELKTSYQNVNGIIADLIKAARQGDVAETLMDEASTALSNIIQQLNSTAIFAQAGQIEVNDPYAISKVILLNCSALEKMTLGSLHDSVKSCSDKIVSEVDSKLSLPDAVEENTSKKAVAAVPLVGEMAKLVIASAAKLDEPASQQQVLAAGAELANSFRSLFDALRAATGAENDPTKVKVLNSASASVKDLSVGVYRSLETASADMLRGENELERVRKLVSQLLEQMPEVASTSPNELLLASREVLAVIAELSFANTQDELVNGAKHAGAAAERLVATSNTASIKLAPTPEIKTAIISNLRVVGEKLREFLETCKINRTGEDASKIIGDSSAELIKSLQTLVNAYRQLPDADKLTLEEEEPEDFSLENQAEEELRRCARLIEEAAQTLMNAQPRRKPKVEGVIDKEDIDEAILLATRAIAQATNTLVQAAEVTQKERRQTAKETGKRYHVDAAWANGLISAAQAVAGSVQALVQASNGTVQGTAPQGALVATAHGVAQATAHLVAASKAKSDPTSPAVRGLSNAAKAVANATSKLVDAANQAARLQEQEEEEDEVASFSFAALQRKELEQQMKIAQLEAELQKERRKLASMRKARYNKQ